MVDARRTLHAVQGRSATHHSRNLERHVIHQWNKERAAKMPMLTRHTRFPTSPPHNSRRTFANKVPMELDRGAYTQVIGQRSHTPPRLLRPGTGPDLDLHLVLLPRRVRLLPVEPSHAVRVHLHVKVPDHPRQDRLGLGVRQAGKIRVSMVASTETTGKEFWAR